MTMITRFAPSPTGMLHIGGARTALFNVLLAKHNAGTFLLRIEDTDKSRSTPEATQAIIEALDWLGLVPDEAPVFQSANADRHVACAQEMLATGAAFKCYSTPEELQTRREQGEELRNAAKQDGLSEAARQDLLQQANEKLAPFRSPWRNGAPAPSPDAPYTIRLRAPDQGQICLNDHLQGNITLEAGEIDDLILLRADGTPTYMLAVVVDDHDMGVTLVLRGNDHLRNTFRQIPIYQAMGWQVPEFVHVPLIHGEDGGKLSKRHGALSTLAYRDMGYLPEAVCAYLLRLGWSHGDTEIFTLEEAANVFSLGGLNKAASRLDLAKLDDVNSHFIRAADPDRLLDLLSPFIEAHIEMNEPLKERIRLALPTLSDRGNTLPELANACRFLWDNNAAALTKNARKALKPENLTLLGNIRQTLDAAESWTIEGLEKLIAEFCDLHDLSIGRVGPPLRAAITGGLPAPDLAPVLSWIGREETLKRIDIHMPH